VCRVIDQLADLGCMKLTFTGGEPIARPDFFSVLEYAWQQRMASVVLTNGTLITPATAATLANLHVLELQVSLYGASAQVHETVTRVPGSFPATLDGIQHLSMRGLRVRVMMPVLALNVQEVGAVREICEQLGVTFQRSLSLFPGDDESRTPLSCMASDEQLCWLAKEEMDDKSLYAGVGGATELAQDRPLCTAGIQQLGIGPDGSVYPCGALRLPAGNIHRQEMATIWHASPTLEGLRRTRPSFPEPCLTCQVRQFCFWCPGLSLAMEGSMKVPNHQDCRRTRIFYGENDCGSI
jgi:radical SAM protein with 4Fe4S-binding SPASM domain